MRFLSLCLVIIALGITSTCQSQSISNQSSSRSSFAIGADGTLYGWGQNYLGQLGVGTTSNKTSPVVVPLPAGAKRWQAISSSNLHTLALTDNGDLYAWGFNKYGELGIGNNDRQTSPVRVAFPEGVDSTSFRWTLIAASESILMDATVSARSYAVGSNGKLYQWGHVLSSTSPLSYWNRPKEKPLPTSLPSDFKIMQISAGYQHTMILGNDQQIYTWGSNANGRLGVLQTDGFYSDEPIKVAPARIWPSGDTICNRWKQIVAGYWHSVAIGTDNRVYAWGFNQSGQCATGKISITVIHPNAPFLCAGQPVRKFVSVAAGFNFTAALTAEGEVYYSGFIGNGVGDAYDTIKALTVAASGPCDRPSGLGAGGAHLFLKHADGSVKAKGVNEQGQLGNCSNDATNFAAVVGVDCKGTLSLGAQGGSATRLAVGPSPCAPLLVFESSIAWQAAGAGKLKVSAGEVTINGLLKFKGTMIVDTSGGRAQVESDGAYWLENIPLPLGLGTGRYTLWKGLYSFNSVPNEASVIALPFSGSEVIDTSVTVLSGFRLWPSKITFNGADGTASSLTLAAFVDIPGVLNSCALENIGQWGQLVSRFDLKAVEVSPVTGITIRSASTKNLGLPGFCLKELGFSYEPKGDTLTLDAVMNWKLLPKFEELSARAMLRGGKVSRLAFGMRLKNAIGPVKGSDVGLKGLTGILSGIDSGKYDATLIATITASQGGSSWRRLSEHDFTGRWLLGTSQFEGAVTSKFWQLPGTEVWQYVTDTRAKIDFDRSIDLGFTIKLGTWGNDMYLLNGYANATVGWNPRYTLGGKVGGVIHIPAPDATTIPILRNLGAVPEYIAAALKLPFTFTGTEIGIKDFVLYVNSIGTGLSDKDRQPWHFKLDLEHGWQTGSYFGWGTGTIDLSRTVASQDVASAPSGTIATDGASIAISPTAADSSVLAITVPNGVQRVLIRVSSTVRLPLTYLIDPTGTRVDGTNADTTIHYGLVPWDSVAYWTILSPLTGTWKIVVLSPGNTDSLKVTGILKDRDPLSLQASQSAATINATWQKGSDNDAEIDLYLDTDSMGFDGFLIGSVLESAGSFDFELPQTLSDCAYYLYGVRVSRDVMSRAYASRQLVVPRTLQPPEIVSVTQTGSRAVRIRWNGNDVGSTRAYVVRYTTIDGFDSVVASLFGYESEITLFGLPASLQSIGIARVDTGGNRSCWTQRVVALSVTARPGGLEPGNSRVDVNLHPNPATRSLTINAADPEAKLTQVTLFDALGKVVFATTDELDGRSSSIVVDVRGLPSGWYTARITTTKGYTSTIVLRR